VSEESGTPSFREQAMARLDAERDSMRPEPAPENVPGTAPEEIGTPDPMDDVVDSNATESIDEVDQEDEELESQEETLEESDDDQDHDWQKRYKDLQSEYTRVMQSREQFESEMTDNLMATKRMQFELEDTLGKAARDAGLLSQALTGNAERFRNIDWSKVPADQVGTLQQQAQQAFAQEAQAQQALNQINEQQQQQWKLKVEREAELTRTRLKRTIPNWSNELYGALANYAEQRGLSRELFNSITDAAVIEMIYDSFSLKTAGQKAKTLSKRKAQKPAAQNKPVTQRDARGRFANAKAHFEQNPNQRGAFAAMKEAQLRAEG
jgi:hypothetical protein